MKCNSTDRNRGRQIVTVIYNEKNNDNGTHRITKTNTNTNANTKTNTSTQPNTNTSTTTNTNNNPLIRMLIHIRMLYCYK